MDIEYIHRHAPTWILNIYTDMHLMNIGYINELTHMHMIFWIYTQTHDYMNVRYIQQHIHADIE